jgi:hypothetical protein
MAVIPTWLKLITTVSQTISIHENLTEAQLKQMHGLEKLVAWYIGGGIIGSIKRHAAANAELAVSTDEAAAANTAYVPTAEEVAAAEQALSDARQEQYTNVSTLAQDLTTSTDELRAAERDLYEYTLKHPLDKKGIQDRQDAVDALKQKQQDMVDQWMLNVMTTMLTADGNMSDGDYAFLLDFQQNSGMIDASARARAESLWRTARSMTAANASIPDEVVNVTTVYRSVNQGGHGGGTGNPLPQAEGSHGWQTVPPGFANDTFPMALSSGETYAVVPQGESLPGGGGGVTIVLEYKPFISLADRTEAQRNLVPILEEWARGRS